MFLSICTHTQLVIVTTIYIIKNECHFMNKLWRWEWMMNDYFSVWRQWEWIWTPIFIANSAWVEPPIPRFWLELILTCPLASLTYVEHSYVSSLVLFYSSGYESVDCSYRCTLPHKYRKYFKWPAWPLV